MAYSAPVIDTDCVKPGDYLRLTISSRKTLDNHLRPKLRNQRAFTIAAHVVVR